jgi:hypothetical protein
MEMAGRRLWNAWWKITALYPREKKRIIPTSIKMGSPKKRANRKKMRPITRMP